MDGKCYLYSKNIDLYDKTKIPPGELSYGEAVLECENRGGKLIESNNNDVFNAIIKVNYRLQIYFWDIKLCHNVLS